MDGKPTNSTIDWKCVPSGDTLDSHGTSGDQGYGTLLFWDKELGKLVEHGHGSECHWQIEFDLNDETKSDGTTITGRLADGRTGNGTLLIERGSDES